MQQKNSPQEHEYYKKFVSQLPKDLMTLKTLLEWYESHCSTVLKLLNSKAVIFSIKYDAEPTNEMPIVVLKSLAFSDGFPVELIKDYLSSYSSKMCAEKMMLETFIDEVALQVKQSKYN